MTDQCTTLRHVKTTHYVGFENALNGVASRIEWVTQPCGTPLFSDTEREAGTCRSCLAGWSCSDNFPVTPDR
jgi:hypothetical protein